MGRETVLALSVAALTVSLGSMVYWGRLLLRRDRQLWIALALFLGRVALTCSAALLVAVDAGLTTRSTPFLAVVRVGILVDAVSTLLSTVPYLSERRQRLLPAQNDVARALTEAESFAEAAPRILRSFCERLGWEEGAVHLVDRGEEVLRCVALWNRPGDSLEEFGALTRRMVWARDVGIPGRVWATGGPTWVPSIEREPRFVRREAAGKAGLRSAFVVPITCRGRILGVLEFMGRKHRRPDVEMTAMMTSLGSLIGLFIERREAGEARRLSEERLQAILDNSPVVVVTKDAAGRYLFVNRRFEEILHVRREDVLGKTGHELFPRERADAYRANDRKVIEGGKAISVEEVGLLDDGPHTFLSVKFPLRWSEEAPDALCAIAADITERKRGEEALRAAKDAAEAANRELEAFSYSVSHDLRAPLRSIDGFSRALLEDSADRLDDQGKDHLRRVRASTQRMGQLIDAMLHLSRITRIELRHEPVSLSALAGEVAAELRAADPGRDVTFVIAEAAVAHGDPRLLRAALDNLLRNAWKFTRHHATGRIEFGATVEDGEAVFFVRDDGAGFDMAYAGRLFGAFQRLHAAGEFEGMGIGLATVARIVHRHGGRVWAEGAVERGATIYFTLGRGPAEGSHEPEKDPADRGQSGRRSPDAAGVPA